MTLALLNLCTSSYWEPKNVEPLQIRATIMPLQAQTGILTTPMVNDLQLIYNTWIKDPQNNWLKVLPRLAETTAMDLKQQTDVELEESNTEHSSIT